MKISGDGFAPAGQDQGFNVYMRGSVAANTAVTVAVSGTRSAARAGFRSECRARRRWAR